jgi:hypothetical protein
MGPWKQGFEAPQAAATELLVAGFVQLVWFVFDRWQEKSLLGKLLERNFFLKEVRCKI